MAIKIRDKGNDRPKANIIFTDREEPQQSLVLPCGALTV